ncbi:ecto-ADP-ribosyltransferase 5-like [Centropristis striata]|uniref:ecto-ADP-ribosyltransferase 5-like n=1 Tax=Centropristis striata TaxID=184440 RepID=UPI0027DFBA22|nr:ecto-ADP-ribosyltransferase 5-like [Centropristis striata]
MTKPKGCCSLGPAGDRGLSLDMAPNSTDDMYDGCKDEMSKKAPEFLQEEKKNNKFKTAWDEMMAESTPELSKEQLAAIKVYTDNKNGLYRDLNTAVRNQGPQYKTSFRFHAFHFYLTSAIQALPHKCLTVYRRTGSCHVQNVVNKDFRFGSFTSASEDDYPIVDYGNKTCFEIVTCNGADISMYSLHPEEREVLIPPYEVFKVVEIKESSQNLKLPCEFIYRVESTKKPFSKLNCALILI